MASNQSESSPSGSRNNQSTAAGDLASEVRQLSLHRSNSISSDKTVIHRPGDTGSQHDNDQQSQESYYKAWRKGHIDVFETQIANLKKGLTEADNDPNRESNSLNDHQNVTSYLQLKEGLYNTRRYLRQFLRNYKPADKLTAEELETNYTIAKAFGKEPQLS
ncbi:hypothetical protein L204_102274 [Cryptococcus depauperatus]|nr:hypothetical protein L204_06020 [Cryptococcus depauperatus CBS 7855]